MTTRILAQPQKSAPAPSSRQPVIWCVISICVALLLGMFGLPVINTLMAQPADFRGSWTCTQNCPKATQFDLRTGGVFLEIDGKKQRVGFWKWTKDQGLSFQAAGNTARPFKWVFFTSRATASVKRQLWSGAPVVCLQGNKWCYTQRFSLE